MKTFVVDASVCLKWVLEENNSSLALEILRNYGNQEINLVAPLIWEYEIVNAIVSSQKKEKILSRKTHQLFEFLMKNKPNMISISDIMDKCLTNATTFNISAYDSAYVTLAIENNIQLISADDKLVTKIKNPKIVISLKEF